MITHEITDFTNEEIINDLNIEDRIIEAVTPEIKRYPCYRIRASSVGYFVPLLNGCQRRGVYEQTHWEEKELITPQLKLVFEEGNDQEKSVLRLLDRLGIEIIQQQNAFTWDKYNISGTIDGVYIYKGHALPVEIKSMSPNIFNQVHTYEDFKKYPWTNAYKAQITIYMLMKNINKGIFILKNKSNGQVKPIVIELDFELGEAILKTAECINEHIQKKKLPPKIDDREVCKTCPFKMTCLPNIDFGSPLTIEDDPDFERRLKFYIENKEFTDIYKKEYEIIRDRIKASMKDENEKRFVYDLYLVKGKRDKRGAVRTTIKVLEYEDYE